MEDRPQLFPLIQFRFISALPLGGKYCLIDIPTGYRIFPDRSISIMLNIRKAHEM